MDFLEILAARAQAEHDMNVMYDTCRESKDEALKELADLNSFLNTLKELKSKLNIQERPSITHNLIEIAISNTKQIKADFVVEMDLI